MLKYRRVMREDKALAEITCNKCGKSYDAHQSHPDFTTIENTYGYGSTKDGDKYVSHICETCMDAIYALFAVPPQVVSMVVWGEDAGDPVFMIDEVQRPPIVEGAESLTRVEGERLEALRANRTPAAPVAPAGEEHGTPQTEEVEEG